MRWFRPSLPFVHAPHSQSLAETCSTTRRNGAGQFDRPHRFVVSYLWEVPGPRNGFLGQVIGGWQLSGVTAGQSGRPFTIVTGVDSNGDTNTGSDRPDINPSGTFVWDNDHKTFTNNGYYTVPLGSNNLPLTNSLGNGNAPTSGVGRRGALRVPRTFRLAQSRSLFSSTCSALNRSSCR